MTTPADGLAPLIVLEGIDGSGKGTQALQLQRSLNSAGIRASLMSFPRYQSTFFGARIGEFLNGAFGALDQLHPFLVSLLYAGDRYESRDLLQAERRQADLVILDRYVSSNVAHQSAKVTPEKRPQLIEWIQHIEFNLFGLPAPDQIFLLDIPVEASQELIRRKNQRSYTELQADLQEADVSYMANVRNVYLDLAAGDSRWQTVSVMDGDGSFRPVEEIGEEIFQSVRQRFSQCGQ